MAHTYTNHLYHGVYSTKGRRPWLEPAMIPELANIVGSIIRDRKGRMLVFNAMHDHVHFLAMFPSSLAVAVMYRDIKSISTDWIKERFPHLRGFAWQGGYSSFTVGLGNLEEVSRYIYNQQERHRTRTFEEELLAMLKQCDPNYDTQYVFD